jgi:Rps23 Pro-64 3,4-dihydroxylase Tpa1-like proline 4-hydroxylase
MEIKFDYKIYQLSDFLNDEEMSSLSKIILNFNVDLSEVKSTLGFLSWSNNVINKIKEVDFDRYKKIIDLNYITYDDFEFLSNLNETYGYNDDDYFNFFLTYSNETYKKVGIYDLIKKVYCGIVFDLFGKKIKEEYQNTLLGNINIYPKNSFIRKHQDNDPDGKRLFTLLFFLNANRKEEQGSLLKLYTKNDTVNLVPDYKYCILLEHQKHNLIHEVTVNKSDDVRYSIYSPFTIKDYEEKLYDD